MWGECQVFQFGFSPRGARFAKFSSFFLLAVGAAHPVRAAETLAAAEPSQTAPQRSYRAATSS
jgi:hypothetical protein